MAVLTSIVFNKNPFIQLRFEFRLESPQVSDTGTRKARSPASLDYFSNITATSAGLHYYYTLKILIRTRILVKVSHLIIADNITIQELKTFFVSTMEGILDKV